MFFVNQVHTYKKLFSKSFFFDKFFLDNVYQFPKFSSLNLQFSIPVKTEFNKIMFCKVLSTFYLLTGQKPQLLVKNCSLRNIKRKKVMGMFITMHQPQCKAFFDFLVQRQFVFSVLSFQSGLAVKDKSTFAFNVRQKIHDDDILYQLLKISDFIRYQVCLKSTSLTKAHLQSLLVSWKIPCIK
jgi:hypothetical protein